MIANEPRRSLSRGSRKSAPCSATAATMMMMGRVFVASVGSPLFSPIRPPPATPSHIGLGSFHMYDARKIHGFFHPPQFLSDFINCLSTNLAYFSTILPSSMRHIWKPHDWIPPFLPFTDLVPREERTNLHPPVARPSVRSPALSLSRSMVAASDSAICSVTRIAL